VEAITPQVDHVFAVFAPPDTGYPGVWQEWPAGADVIEKIPAKEKRNISRWWNIGIDKCKQMALDAEAKQWDIAILNDDVIVPPNWMDLLAARMRGMNVAAASMGPVRLPILHTRPGQTSLDKRMAGFAFVLAGELGVRADESLEWWCGDNDIDMQSRLKGGTVILPDIGVKHLHPDQSTTGELAAQTAVDMQRFVTKWGFRPW
jgi:hypothetical protein